MEMLMITAKPMALIVLRIMKRPFKQHIKKLKHHKRVCMQPKGGNAYYAGPICASSGTRIKIGVFFDGECSVYDETLDQQ